MAFQLKPKKQTENKTIRFPEELVIKIEKYIQNKDVTFSHFVIQACEYALENAEDDETRYGTRRRSHRPGRLFRNLPPHHAQRPYLHCGRNCTLRRCQYPRRRTLHLHHGTDKCHPALHRSPGMQRLETSLQGRPGSGAGIERSGRQSNIQSCSRRLRAEI